ncbi:hypothetical protein GE061_019782 [Apolygus lucorum]|uniref:Uncharacterized protein n=1 Tax=Apolygus lucorum TaxID=248454 RepID=A0A6A4JY31_APOLU|nr:hypothetical protein GE061_019782 [Apolygus lucorum]
MIKCAAVLMLVGCALARPQLQAAYTTPIPIISQSQSGPNLDGSYSWAYQTGNGISADESGYVKNFGAGEPNEIQTAQGRFSYTAPNGEIVQLEYTADENGFVPRGSHIPTPPPIPEAIQRALDFIASQPQKYDDNGNLIGGGAPQRYGRR